MLQKPLENEFPAHFAKYIAQVPDGNLIALLQTQLDTFTEQVKDVKEEQLNYRYAENKWTLRQVLIHVNDVERIFGYRTLTCLRSDPSNIPGFEQDDYADITQGSGRSIKNLVDEFQALRLANIHLFAEAKDEEWLGQATISNNKTSARSMAYMLFGHVEHHRKINEEKYLG